MSIKRLLQKQLFRAVSLYDVSSKSTNLASKQQFRPENIPLHRLQNETLLIYRSPIALQQEAQRQLKAIDLANKLIGYFPTINKTNATNNYLELSIEVIAPGWINFRFPEQSVGTWLQDSTQIFSSPEEERELGIRGAARGESGIHAPNLTESTNTSSTSKSLPLFRLQYIHARCCSLLRLADKQALIKLKQPESKNLCLQIVEPNPIPWLINYQGVEVEPIGLRLKHPAELGLISKIIDVQDAVNDQSQNSLLKLATILCSSFDNFYSNCRIWGEVKAKNPQLSQARLGLVTITQVLLFFILRERLGVSAPLEL
ncbi:MAG: DALR anticodon-binding domain-containing protein [Coleofasciculaceae cyanobacterium]